MLTVEDVAPLVGMTIKGAQHSLRRGAFPIRYTKVGQQYRFTQADVEAFVERGEVTNELLRDRRRHFFASARKAS